MHALYPLWLPPLIALCSTVVSGLTAFGDAIVFLAVWSLLTTVGVLNEAAPHLLATGVMFTAFMSLSPLPYLTYIARYEIRDSMGWALMSGVPTAALVPLGVYLLIFGNVTVLKAVIGGTFLLFGVSKLWLSLVGEARAKAEGRVTAVDVYGVAVVDGPLDPLLPEAALCDDVPCEREQEAEDGVQPAVEVQTGGETSLNGLPCEEEEEEEEGSACVRFCFKPISPNHSLRFTGAVLFIAGVGAGVFGGMLGVGGPPQIVAFEVLRLHKYNQRGIQVIISWLGGITRIIALVSSSTFHAADWPSYLSVCIAAVIGTAIGASLRARVNTEMILRCLYVLLILSTITLFNVLKRPLTIAVYAGSVTVYAIALLLAWTHPCHSCALPCRRVFAE